MEVKLQKPTNKVEILENVLKNSAILTVSDLILAS